MNITEVEPDDVMDSLIGRSVVSWGKDETMYHVTLDDGRVLVFMSLGIVTYPEDVSVH